MAMSSAKTRLVLIRHGQSRAQFGEFVGGHAACTGLSDLGRRQAEALRHRLDSTGELRGTDVIYTSVLPRAIETAAIIQPATGAPTATSDCEWCEIHAGEADGMTWQELRQRYPVPDDGDNPFRRRAPGMETWAEFYARVGGRLIRAADEHPGESVVVVGHGGTIGAGFVALGDASIRQAIALTHETVNASITEWRGRAGAWRLVRYNDAAHLASVPSDP
jgi:broad specificity phosphatase PhoE